MSRIALALPVVDGTAPGRTCVPSIERHGPGENDFGYHTDAQGRRIWIVMEATKEGSYLAVRSDVE